MGKTQIKSKSRVRLHGEVFTAEREVKAMCDLIPAEIWDNIESTFLEPCVGIGNFVAEILARKFERCKDEKDGLKALASIVGLDIQADNCEESRKRLYDMYCAKFPYCNSFCRAMAERILQNNIRCCDSLLQMQEWIDKMENKPIQLSLF